MVLSSAKKLKLVAELKSMSDNPKFFAKLGEDFDGNKNRIIWTGAEEPWIKGMPLADYYGEYEKTGLGHPKFESWLKKHKLYWEWYDAGTIMIYEDN
jgi:hypothetical protein